jgi:hypothetical protein
MVSVEEPALVDPLEFVEVLAKQIAEALRYRAPEFERHRLGAVAVEPHPWHKGMCLSVLIETDKSRKWEMGDWEYQDLAALGGTPLIEQAYEDLQDPSKRGSCAYLPFFRCCAQALCHQAVQESLKHYALEPDFELFVADPDDPNEVNFCEEIVGVDKKRRKKKTELSNLGEALKDPESVLVLKYWNSDKLTQSDQEGIAQLTNLEVLYLVSVGLKELPSCVFLLPKLKELHLDYNQITQLTGLASLPNLKVLCLMNNRVFTAEMAQVISELPSLRELHVGYCGLRAVPESWRRLTLLEQVTFTGNPLTAIPDWLLELPALKCLGLAEAVDEDSKATLRQQYPFLEIV